MHQYIAQGVGYAALLFVVLSFQRNKRSAVLSTLLAGALLFTVHFSLLGARTGALMNLIAIGVTFVAYKKGTAAWANRPVWLYVSIGLYVLCGMLIYQRPIDTLPVIGQIFGAIAVWQTNPRIIRFIMLLPRPLWFIYNLAVGSQAGVVAELFITSSVVIGIARFDVIPLLSSHRNHDRSPKPAATAARRKRQRPSDQ